MKQTSIPELIKHHGNIAQCAKHTGISEMTVAKYQHDHDCERHVIYNGYLMTRAMHSRKLYSRTIKTCNERPKEEM